MNRLVTCFDWLEIRERTDAAADFFHRAERFERWRLLVKSGKRACATHGVELRWSPFHQHYECPVWPCIYTETRSRKTGV